MCVVYRCGPVVKRWQEKTVNVSTDSIQGALNWIHNLQLEEAHDVACTVEGLLKASNDDEVCIYNLACF